MDRLRRTVLSWAVHILVSASMIGPRQVEHTLSAVYEMQLLVSAKGLSSAHGMFCFFSFWLSFASAIVCAGERVPELLFRTEIRSRSQSLGLLTMAPSASGRAAISFARRSFRRAKSLFALKVLKRKLSAVTYHLNIGAHKEQGQHCLLLSWIMRDELFSSTTMNSRALQDLLISSTAFATTSQPCDQGSQQLH